MTGEFQIVILVTADGREHHYSGQATLKQGDLITDIRFTEPQPLPDGYSWEKLMGNEYPRRR